MQPEEIIADVCSQHRITLDLLRSQRRSRELTAARRECINRLHRAGVRKNHIAKLLNRDHAAILYHL